MRRSLLIVWAVAMAAGLCLGWLNVGATSRADGPPGNAGDATQRAMKAGLDRLDIMLRYRWRAIAQSQYDDLAAQATQNKVSSPAVLDRLARAKDALATQPDTAARRVRDLVQRVRSADSNFPDKPKLIRVRSDGAGDAKTIADAVNQGGDLIELATEIYPINPADFQGEAAKRLLVFMAAPGHWPRLVPAPGVDVPLDRSVWLEGVELVVTGPSPATKGPVSLRDCYIRSPRPPKTVTEGASGLVAGPSAVSNCVLENFVVGLTAGKEPVSHNLFIACVAGVQGGQGGDEGSSLDHCAFYRCVSAVGKGKVSASACVFGRCKNVAGEGATVDQQDCLPPADDPFVDPFRGNFQLRPDLQSVPEKLVKSPAGPRWSSERWEWFAANFDRPIDEKPVSLGELLDARGTTALAAARSACQAKDYTGAAKALRPVLDQYAICPSVRSARGEIDKMVEEVLAALSGSGGAVAWGDSTRRVAAELLRQATTAREAGRKDEALAVARRAADGDPGYTDAQQLAADLLLDDGRPAKAKDYLKRASDALAAEPDGGAAAAKAAEAQIQKRFDSVAGLAQDWKRLLETEAQAYARIAGSPGPPSTALAWRRARLLNPDIKDYKDRLVIADSLLKPLRKDSTSPDIDKAKKLRDQADKAFGARKYGDAGNDRRDAFRLDPGSEDLLFIARCYQRDQQPAEAAVMALQARQMAQASVPVNAKTVTDANEILHTVDKPMITLETHDREFIAMVETRRKGVELRDKDTAEAMTQLLEKLAKLDVLVSDKGGE